MSYCDPSQWFDALGTCRCGKKATGVLRGTHNQSMGPYCEPCANTRIKKATREREKAPPHPAAVALASLKEKARRERR